MTTRRSAKNALVLSAVSLFLCLAMLIGTTFAWFTDSVTSANNIIATGTLDVELYHSDKNVTGEKVDATTKLFDEVELWEPGVMVWEEFTVVNEGSLALKYQLSLNANNASVIDGKSFATMLKVAVVDAGFDYSRENVEAITTWQDFVSFNLEGELLARAEGETEYPSKGYGIVIWWQPTDDDNHFNMNNGKTGEVSIEVGVSLVATQYTYEEDSFGPEYDKDAIYAEAYASNAAELIEAIANAENGDTIALMGDIDLSGASTYALRSVAAPSTITIAEGADVIIDLNGYNITASSAVTDASVALIEVKGGNLTVTGEGTIALNDVSGASFNASYRHAAIVISKGTVTLGEGVNIVCTSADANGASAMSYAVDVMPQAEATLNVNGATLHSSYIGVRLWALYAAGKGTVNFNDGIIQGDKNGYDLWVQGMDQKGTAIVNVAEGIAYATEDISGTIYEFENNLPVVVDSAEALASALQTSGNYILDCDIALDETITIPAGVTVVLNLNGKTITAPDAAICAIQNNGTLTVTGNGTIEGSYTALYSNGNLTIENGTFTATDGFGVLIDNIYGTETSVAVINDGTFTGLGIYNPTDVTINGGTFNVGRDPDGATDHLSDEMTLFISPTFVGAPNTANVVLNGGTFNGDVYVYDDGITETQFVNNGATITGDVLDNN